MALLERIVQMFLGGTPQKCLLIELFQRVTDAECGVVLEETGLPHGGTTTYTWWKSKDAGYFTKVHRDFDEKTNANDDECETTQDTAQRYDELRSLIEEFGCLENYSANIRDGVVYRVFWGTEESPKRLTISNPAAGSRHHQLVTRLKENAWR